MEREIMRKNNNGPDPIEQRITELKQRLLSDIDSLNLSREIEQQPALFYSAAQLLADAQVIRDHLKMELENAEARVSHAIRDGYVSSVKPPTIPEIDARVCLDPGVRAIRQALSTASGNYVQMQALKEGYAQRGWSIRDAVELQTKAQSIVDIEAHRAEVNEQRIRYNATHERKTR